MKKPAGKHSEGGDSPRSIDEQVDALIKAGKSRQAVELAKDNHKKVGTPPSELLLVNAYVARIKQFQDKGAAEDARTLIKLVHDRFPAHAQKLQSLEFQANVDEGRFDLLVAPLANAQVAPQVKEAIESTLRTKLIDLPPLASAQTLPANHALRVEAAALDRAFRAVAAGLVTDEQVALHEVPRRSPLAAWKLLIRAIASFYRQDDVGCRRAVEGIASDAAVRPLADVLRAAIDRTGMPRGIAASLKAKIVEDDESLRLAMNQLDADMTGGAPLADLLNTIRTAMSACVAARPELVERLQWQIAVKCHVNGVPTDSVQRAIGAPEPPRRDANYWRSLAIGCEKMGYAAMAAVAWTLFLRHAVAEHLILADSPEAGAIHLRAASDLSHSDRREREDVEYRLVNDWHEESLARLYEGQPPQVAEAAPKDAKAFAATALGEQHHFGRAAELNPTGETFAQWTTITMQTAPEKQADRRARDIIERWSKALPNDPKPHLLLSNLAENRKAFKTALSHLAAAEAIAPANPGVRSARLRVTLSTAWRHFKEGKPHLIDADLAQLAEMPLMNEGDRPALLQAMKAARHALAGNTAAALQAYADLEQSHGPIFAGGLLRIVQETGQLQRIKDWPFPASSKPVDSLSIATADGRLMKLVLSLDLRALRLPQWDAPILAAFEARPCRVPLQYILATGTTAEMVGNERLAYVASSAVLSLTGGPAADARALLLRAQSFPDTADSRISQCLCAAMDLARQSNQPSLIEEVSRTLGRYPWMRNAAARPLSDELLQEVLAAERRADKFPTDFVDRDRAVVLHQAPMPSPFLDETDDDDDEYDYDDDGSKDHDADFNLLPDTDEPIPSALLEELAARSGLGPEQLLKNPAPLLEHLAKMMGVKVTPELIKQLLSDFHSGGEKKKRRK